MSAAWECWLSLDFCELVSKYNFRDQNQGIPLQTLWLFYSIILFVMFEFILTLKDILHPKMKIPLYFTNVVFSLYEKGQLLLCSTGEYTVQSWNNMRVWQNIICFGELYFNGFSVWVVSVKIHKCFGFDWRPNLFLFQIRQIYVRLSSATFRKRERSQL